MSDLRLDEGALTRATEELGRATSRMLTGNASRPTGGFESLTGIADDVDLYLRGVSVARAGLSDAAKTAGQATRQLMRDSAVLDAQLAAALSGGFAVPRSDH